MEGFLSLLNSVEEFEGVEQYNGVRDLGQKCSAYSFVKVAHSLLSLFAPAISH
jgi:hypothetical protein